MLHQISFVLVITFTTIFNVFPTKADEPKTYIVHLSSALAQNYSQPELEQWYNSFLSKITSEGSDDQKPTMVFSYRHVITGFAATMSPDQATTLANLSGVLSVRPQGFHKLHTTRSPYFLGLRKTKGLWSDSNSGKGIIIGIVDTGITPGHPSFDDKGVPPPPARWRGKCEIPGCNNKLIGMRSFLEGKSPVDVEGHGTHTSSTAAGNSVDNTSIFGNANGTATGIAPLAHLAMYKVCELKDCEDSRFLAGMDAAIEDGVDVLSISLGGYSKPFYDEAIAIGAFAAIQKGILVSCSAGNLGPDSRSISNEAPWILTVGASTIDRRIQATVILGNKKLYNGEWLYQPKDFDQTLKPLVCPGGLKETSCVIGSPEHNEEGSAAATINRNLISEGETIALYADRCAAALVGYKEGVEIIKYLNSTSSPVATILFGGTILGVNSAPEVAYFSSRGPNKESPGILKPDIIGPGLNILAAWKDPLDNQKGAKAAFHIDSGTSMSCPHISGIAALLKSAHPEWSPAAIKSAIMTTASQVSHDGHAIADERELPADVFAIGSGHVNPSKASDPGLVFDIQPDDYIPYLCGLGYPPEKIQLIVKKPVSCSKTIPEAQLNYPSFAISLKQGDNKTYSRTVTNVGEAKSTYTIRDVSVPEGVGIVVAGPSSQGRLSFTKLHQKLTYDITFTRDSRSVMKAGTYGQGHMTWKSGKYTVRTPFSIKFE